ncbi:MAG: DNA repair protein RecN [Firmicutes bacterium HGW-Firmicutes-19]|nr:MAG: DNA repair protein RecN [Firmicutes bacterium HGW-Firmicutes-19]
MIRQITVKNFVLIDEITLDLSLGMSVFTGETGAGKSLLIDAIGLLCGDRASSQFIRKNAHSAFIEGVFEIAPQSKAGQLCKEFDIDVTDLLIISREITVDGKSSSKINHRLTPLSVVRELTSAILDIHSQHDSQYLLNDKYHLSLLDEYIGENIALDSVKSKYQQWNSLVKEVDEKSSSEYNVADLDFLNFQIQEIEAFNPSQDDFDALEQKQRQLMAFEKISKLANASLNLLDETEGVKEKLFESYKSLSACHEDTTLFELGSSLESLYYQIEDITEELNHHLSKLEFSEDDLNMIQQRLFDYGKLKRKYGNAIDLILKKKDEFKNRVFTIENRQDVLEDLIRKRDRAFVEYQQAAYDVSVLRKEKALELENEIIRHLKDLQLENTRFVIEISEGKPTSSGSDKVVFVISTNPGEPLRPLSKVASGGELSRIMLGLKAIFTKLQGISTIIFDEIDTGVSGIIATKIGQKMHSLSKDAQILTVTHLAQVAACGNEHFLVSKEAGEDTTLTNIERLDDQKRIEQLALISSGTLSDKAITAARELYLRNRNTN